MAKRSAVGRWLCVPLCLLVLLLMVNGCQPKAADDVGRFAATAPATTAVTTVPPTAVPPTPTVAPAQPSAVPQASYDGAPVGLTADGFPYWGEPDAPIIIDEYTDLLCSFCARHALQTLPALGERYIATGQVQYIFHDMPLESIHPNAPQGHAAARCVAEQGAALFWEMHDELFQTQGDWASLSDPGPYLAEAAARAGAASPAYEECIASGRAASQVQQSVAAAAALGITATPTFRFTVRSSGETYPLRGAQPIATFEAWIDALLAGQEPPQAQTAPTAAPMPFWATPAGLAPDPERPGFTVAGDAYKGDPNAPLVVVEFSNVQCSACLEHHSLVQPTLDETFVETGKALWVYKHLPISSLPQSFAAAVAIDCAGEQGAFWPMHDLLFERQGEWAVDPPEDALRQLAGELGLDEARFRACQEDPASAERVSQDVADAQGIVDSTPSFVVLHGGRGGVLVGSRAPEEFVSILNSVLAPTP